MGYSLPNQPSQGGGGAADPYSTAEVETGKTWTSGEKIYRKVVAFDWLGTATLAIAHGIAGLTDVTSISGVWFGPFDGKWHSIPCVSGSNLDFSADANKIYLLSNFNHYSIVPCRVVLEYIK